MGAQNAQLLPEDSRILLVEDENLNRFYYFMDKPGAIPVFGFPVSLYDRGANFNVHVFVPLPTGVPILLAVEPTTPVTSTGPNPVTSPHTEMS